MTEGLSRLGFDGDLREGEHREDAFSNVLRMHYFEHKRDYLYCKTGNVAVEYMQLCRDGVWRKSGICVVRDDAYWAVEYAKDCHVMLPAVKLKAIIKANDKSIRRARGGDNNSTWNFLVPMKLLLEGDDVV